MRRRFVLGYGCIIGSFPISFFALREMFSGAYVSATLMLLGAFGLMGLGRHFLSIYDADAIE